MQQKKTYNTKHITKLLNHQHFKAISIVLSTYYKIHDIDNGTNIHQLFFDTITAYDTKEYHISCDDYYISESTLYRYRQNFYFVIDELLQIYSDKDNYIIRAYYELQKELKIKGYI